MLTILDEAFFREKRTFDSATVVNYIFFREGDRERDNNDRGRYSVCTNTVERGHTGVMVHKHTIM
jgi:hypothetical protein